MANLENAGTRSPVEFENHRGAPALDANSPARFWRGGHAFRQMVQWLAPLLVWTVLLTLWEIAAANRLISPLFFPAPSTILRTFVRLIASGELLRATGDTLLRQSIGLLFGGGAGLILGLLMGSSRTVRALLNPVVAAIHPMPKVALFPLALILFGIGETSKLVLVSLTAFFPMLLNSMAGVQQIDALTLDVARQFKVRGGLFVRRVLLPGSLPLILVGLQLAFNTALVVTIAVELLSGQTGLGAMIWMAWQTLHTADLYAALIAIGLIGVAMNFMLHRLALRLIPWREQ